MKTADRNLLDIVEDQTQQPHIDADACVHSLLGKAECQTCVDACPAQAWMLDDNALGLDTQACDGCGLCVAGCPTGALQIPYPWIIRAIGGQKIALFACDKSDVEDSAELIPCVHSLGVRQLLLLINFGIEYLLVATGECKECPRNAENVLEQRVEQLNKLLAERGKQSVKILRRSAQVWSRLFKTDELITHGTILPRRDFLTCGGRLVRRQMAVIDPLNLHEYRTLPPGQLLGDTGSQTVHWPHAPSLDETRCNGCDACVNTCPTEALKLLRDEDRVINGYRIDPADCTGCGICSNVCDSAAISVSSNDRVKTYYVDLAEDKCRACGNPFHHPVQSNLAEHVLCTVCSEHNHPSNLFQILNE